MSPDLGCFATKDGTSNHWQSGHVGSQLACQAVQCIASHVAVLKAIKRINHGTSCPVKRSTPSERPRVLQPLSSKTLQSKTECAWLLKITALSCCSNHGGVYSQPCSVLYQLRPNQHGYVHISHNINERNPKMVLEICDHCKRREQKGSWLKDKWAKLSRNKASQQNPCEICQNYQAEEDQPLRIIQLPTTIDELHSDSS